MKRTSLAPIILMIFVTSLFAQGDPDGQPWEGEPFISQFIFQDQWSNAFLEIVNPSTSMIDMGQYMLFFGSQDNPNNAITSASGSDDFSLRYNKYIPGYAWVDSLEWLVMPGICVPDPTVNSLVAPGDVFVLTDIRNTTWAYDASGYGEGNWPAENAGDVHFGKNCTWDQTPIDWTALKQWTNEHIYLFKIIGDGGDSVRSGLKPANDPDDFLLIDVWGDEGYETPIVGGEEMAQTTSYTRKPNIYQGNTEMGGSWGEDEESSEWIKVDRAYLTSIGEIWPMDLLKVTEGIGSHYMNEVTVYKSTVTSSTYEVSEGYSLYESIIGVLFETSVDEFLSDIQKEDQGQVLTVKSGGQIISGSDLLMNGDYLEVLSADGNNISRYFIEVGSILEIYPAEDIEVCLGQSANLSVEGDFYGDYSISWNNGIQDGVDFIPFETGDYIVTVTNIHGSSYDTVRVFVRPLPPAEGVDKEICFGESVTLTATGGVLYEWDKDVLNGHPFTPASTDEYHVLIVNNYGCITRDTVVVTVNPLPQIDAGEDQEICLGNEVILSATGEGDFTWNHSVVNGEAFIPVETDKYRVSTIDENGCSNSDSVTVVVHPLPIVNAGEDTEVCLGNETTLSATGEGDFTWNHEVVNGVAFIPEETKEYEVTTVDVNGCINSDSVTIVVNPLPEIHAGTDQEICLGDEVVLTASGDGVQTWDNGVMDGESFVPAETQKYYVTALDENGCSNNDSVTVLVNPVPEIFAGADQEICLGEQVTLVASGDDGYTWENGVVDGVPFSPQITETYHVTSVNGHGCFSRDSVKITVYPLPYLDAGEDMEICAGEEVILEATGDGQFTWDQGVTDGVAFIPEQSTEYHVSSRSIYGCLNADSVNVAVIHLDTSVTINGNILIANAVSAIYQWIDCSTGEIIPGESNKSFSPTENGSYAVQISRNDCNSYSSCYEVFVLGMEDRIFGEGITYYPNPVSDRVSIDLGDTYQNVMLKVYDVTGQLLISHIHEEGRVIQLDIHAQTPGIYFIDILNSQQKTTLKIIKN